jgi:hypothetical protein
MLQRRLKLNLNTVTIDHGLPTIQAHADIYDFLLPLSFLSYLLSVFCAVGFHPLSNSNLFAAWDS